jgi:hypothetical protein
VRTVDALRLSLSHAALAFRRRVEGGSLRRWSLQSAAARTGTQGTGAVSRRALAASTAQWRVRREQGLGATRIMHRRPTSTSVVVGATLLLGLLVTATATERPHAHLHGLSHADSGGAMAPGAFYGLMDTDEALRRAFDATSDNGRVVLVATAGGDHVVTALNLILQVNPLPDSLPVVSSLNAKNVACSGGCGQGIEVGLRANSLDWSLARCCVR